MAEAAKSPTEIHAGAREADRRRRGGRPPPPPRPPPPRPLPPHPPDQGSATRTPPVGAVPRDTDVGEATDAGEVSAASEDTVAGGATAAGGATGAGEDSAASEDTVAGGATAARGATAAGEDSAASEDTVADKAAPAPATAPAAAGPGAGRAGTSSARARGRMARNSASSRLAVGRLPGCLARQASTGRRSSSGSSPRSGGLLTSRYISAALDPEPNGPCPLAAYISTAPRLKMSLAGPMSWPRACSGDENSGESKSSSGCALALAGSEIPNSTSRGPSSVSRTFEGLRFRCTTPAACNACRPIVSQVASASTAEACSGPPSRILSASEGASTYAVASHGTGASRSASSTGAMKAPVTSRAAATSARNPGSTATSAGTTVTATRSPSGERPRNRPLRSSGLSNSYGPTVLDSSVVRGVATLIPPTPTEG
jgi:hypothetical protein